MRAGSVELLVFVYPRQHERAAAVVGMQAGAFRCTDPGNERSNALGSGKVSLADGLGLQLNRAKQQVGDPVTENPQHIRVF